MLKPIVLQIIKGVPPAPSDPNSAEAAMVTLDLLDTNGLALEIPDGWSPNLPSLKNGGTWVESAVSNGSQLLGSAVANVTETMTLVCGNPDIKQRFGILSKLGILQQAARDFSEGWQADPVYLKWHAAEGVGAQYAPIFNIEIANRGDMFDTNSWTITLTIVRYHKWLGLWLGGNPLEWHFMKQGKVRGSAAVTGYDYNDLNLMQNSDHFAYGTLQNRTEFNSSTYLSFLSQNWIDIDGANIPGDAPALMLLSFYGTMASGISHKKIIVARSTKPRTLENRDTSIAVGTDVPAFNILNAGDANGSSLITKSSDTCGVISNGSNSTQYLGSYSVAGGAASSFTANVVLWSISDTPYKPLNLFRGQWEAYLRCKQTAGTQGDVRLRLVVRNGSYSKMELDEQTVPVMTPAANCEEEWGLISLGQFRLPFDKNAFSSADGRGLQGAFGSIAFELQTRNTQANARTLEFLDLILMPVDEACCMFHRTVNTAITLNANTIIFDKTGYLTHGQLEDVCITNSTAPSNPPQTNDFAYDNPQELIGEIPELVPGVNNRLYFLSTVVDASGNEFSLPSSAIQVRINIIPCWIGVRSE